MADDCQHQQDTTARRARGGGQLVANLCRVNGAGLAFWSRHRFDVAAELQMRVRAEALPSQLRTEVEADKNGWVSVRGYVVECRAVRGANGSALFRVSVMLEKSFALTGFENASTYVPIGASFHGRRIFGQN